MKTTEEIWKPVKGFEDGYEVSNLGRIRSVDRYVPYKKRYRKFVKGMVLSPILHSRGYLKVSLCKNESKRKQYFVHRIVATAFLDNPDTLPQVNHKDMDKTNNCVDNLEWCDNSWNNKHSFLYGDRKRLPSGDKHPKSKKVLLFDMDNNFVCGFGSIGEASRETGIPKKRISAVLNNDYMHSYKKTRWQYA